MTSRLHSLALAFLFAIPAWAGAQEKGEEKSERTQEELQSKVDSIIERVGETMGVKPKGKVVAAYQSREEFEKFIRQSFEKEYPAEKMEPMVKSYVLLGLVPKDFDLVKTMTETIKHQAGAYYDPETKKMYVLTGDMPDQVLDMFIFHELVHALQDQEHDLAKNMKALEGSSNSDAAGAYRYLVEAEASYWSQAKDMDKMPEQMREMSMSMTKDATTREIVNMMDMQAMMMGGQMPSLRDAAKQIRKVPAIMVRGVVDPYIRGIYLGHKIVQRDGPEGFRKLFRTPPASMRDVLFPDQFFEAPRPTGQVKFANLQDALGKDWKKYHDDTLGALTLHVMFEDQKPQANAIAKAWDADRSQVWKKGHAAFVAGVLAFADEKAASTFAKQLERVYREKWTKGEKLEEHKADFTHLSAGEDHLLVQVKGKNAAFTRGALPVDAGKLLDALWKSEIKVPEPAKKSY